MTGYWNNQSYMNRNGPPFQILANVDAVCKYCGKTFDFLIYHRCSATNAYCYKCRHLGHFARVCSLHNCESPVTKPRKRKSNSKIQRDKLRMEKFIERKRTTQFQFPFSTLDDKELCALTNCDKSELKQAKIGRIKASERNLRKNLKILESEHSYLEKLLHNANRTIAQLKTEKTEDANVINRLRSIIEGNNSDEVQKLRQENENLRRRLSTEIKNAEIRECKIIKDFSDKIQRFERQNFDLNSEIQDLLSNRNQIPLTVQPGNRMNQARRSKPFKPGTHCYSREHLSRR